MRHCAETNDFAECRNLMMSRYDRETGDVQPLKPRSSCSITGRFDASEVAYRRATLGRFHLHHVALRQSYNIISLVATPDIHP